MCGDGKARILEFLSTRQTARDPADKRIENHLLKLWCNFHSLADNHFLDEFCSGNEETFYQRYWEMALGNHLLSLGCVVQSSGVGPDFKLSSKTQTIWVEAVTPNPGTGKNQIPPRTFGELRQVPSDEILLRWSSAFQAKCDKRNSYIKKGIIAETDPFIIAINSGLLDQPNSNGISQYPYALEVVYPIGSQQLSIPPDNPKIATSSLQYRPEIANANGSLVRTDIFLNQKFAGISGLLASTERPFDVPLKNQSELVFVHNHYAYSPISEGVLGVPVEYSIKPDRSSASFQICEQHF